MGNLLRYKFVNESRGAMRRTQRGVAIVCDNDAGTTKYGKSICMASLLCDEPGHVLVGEVILAGVGHLKLILPVTKVVKGA